MWKNWDEKGIEGYINKVKNLGINFLRVFILDEDFIDVYGNGLNCVRRLYCLNMHFITRLNL